MMVMTNHHDLHAWDDDDEIGLIFVAPPKIVVIFLAGCPDCHNNDYDYNLLSSDDGDDNE